MRVLFITSEVAPFSKTGGLADVSQALPRALGELGHEVWVVSPRYQEVDTGSLRRLSTTLSVPMASGRIQASLWVRQEGRVQWVFIDEPTLFDRAGLYGDARGDYADNAARFLFLARSALEAGKALGVSPQVVHLNDWQTAMAAWVLKRELQSAVPCVFTVHNLAYQGLFPAEQLHTLGLPASDFTYERLEFYGQLSFIKAGLVFADALTTVSPRYAQEIQTAELGCGLDGLLRHRSKDLHGILNGIDVESWDPRTDKALAQPFDAVDLNGKEACARAVLREMGLNFPSTGQRPVIFGAVGRMVEQKGVDLWQAHLPRLLEHNVRVVVLGSGEQRFVDAYQSLQKRFADKLAVRVGFDDGLARRIEAGCDFFVMPSRFEPCGLNQMYSQRYGALPIVRRTGGLADTVDSTTGVVFDGEALGGALERALDIWQRPSELEAMRRNAMKRDFSWASSARRYAQLYASLTAED